MENTLIRCRIKAPASFHKSKKIGVSSYEAPWLNERVLCYGIRGHRCQPHTGRDYTTTIQHAILGEGLSLGDCLMFSDGTMGLK